MRHYFVMPSEAPRAVALRAEYTLKHDESLTQSECSQSESFCDKVGGARSLLFTELEFESVFCYSSIT